MSTSFNTGKDALSFGGICCGSMALVSGLIFYYTMGLMVGTVGQWIFLSLVVIAGLFLLIGLALYPGSRERAKLWKKVLEIAAVEKEVSISDLHMRTGIDAEVVRQILVHCLMRGMLFGYIEGDLFVRDTSARPSPYFRGVGLYRGS
ncbi:MAG: hypothetical protein PVJ05_10355 [Candidatus Thorarchaeota archaeon]